MSKIFGSLGSAYRWVIQPVLVIAILALGFFGAMGLSSSREAPERQEQESYAPLVRVETIRIDTLPITVKGHGSLQARTRIDLIPQVGGRVIEMHPALRAGGRFAAGEVLARVESIDYELALARARSEVSSSETALEIQLAEAAAAADEWRRMQPDEPVPALVGREPQIQEARARLAAAEAQVAGAQLDLDRTALSLPFDGRVVDANIDVGQVLSPNVAIASVYGTEVFEVPVPLEVGELGWIDLPGEGPADPAGPDSSGGSGGSGSPARVILGLGERELLLEGRAVRLESELDGTSRLSRLIVELNTAELEPATAARLLPGQFVDVEIDGGELDGVVALPREVMRELGVVWTVVDGRIRFVTPKIERSTEDELFVSGLEPGGRIVTSNLEVVTDGMEVRVLPAAKGEIH